MIVDIGRSQYDVQPHGPDAWTLERPGAVYCVDDSGERTRCDCPDWQYRHAELDGTLGCKHIRALRELGLVRAAPQGWAVAAPPEAASS